MSNSISEHTILQFPQFSALSIRYGAQKVRSEPFCLTVYLNHSVYKLSTLNYMKMNLYNSSPLSTAKTTMRIKKNIDSKSIMRIVKYIL